jgi:hypothetical protein
MPSKPSPEDGADFIAQKLAMCYKQHSCDHYRHSYGQRTGTSHCTFNVDRIYGLLGLVSENVRRHIKIDYAFEERFWEVWLSAGKVISELERDRLYLLLKMSDENDDDKKCLELPLWFPDLRGETSVARYPFLWLGAAAGGSRISANLWTSENSNKLWIVGLSIDVVEDAFPSNWYWPDALEKV